MLLLLYEVIVHACVCYQNIRNRVEQIFIQKSSLEHFKDMTLSIVNNKVMKVSISCLNIYLRNLSAVLYNTFMDNEQAEVSVCIAIFKRNYT